MKGGVIGRIWERAKEVDCSDPESCWEWPGGRCRGDYGTIGGGHTTIVSRLVLEEALGRPLRPKYKACHSCDNPPCFNPSHLFEGTQQENLRDALRKGRVPLGDRASNGKLTSPEVLKILRDGRPSPLVAADYGVTDVAIRMIRTGRSWGWLTGIERPSPKRVV